MEYLDLLQPLLQTLITVLLPPLLAVAAAWLLKVRRKIEAEIGEQNLVILRELTEAFVRAAEQSGLSDQIENIAEAKRNYVLERLQAESDRLGLRLDVRVLEAMIEDAYVDVFGFSDAS